MIVTFDFDDTLTRPVWDKEEGLWLGSLRPNEPVLAELRRISADGHSVHVVTSRSRSTEREVQLFVDTHGLPVRTTSYTNGDFKGETLAAMGSACHFDDSVLEYDDCAEHGVRCVLIPHPYDREKYPDRIQNAETFNPPTKL